MESYPHSWMKQFFHESIFLKAIFLLHHLINHSALRSDAAYRYIEMNASIHIYYNNNIFDIINLIHTDRRAYHLVL